jgi:L-threonylcarbamoyladenylate synthase
MRILTKEEFENNKEYFLLKIGQGAVFIYPTDTIYGIGCNARDPVAVKRLRKIKKRDKLPFSVIAPDKEWIQKNCSLSYSDEVWINRLPGKLTLILKLKNKDAVHEMVAPGLDTIGVRIPNHWISKVAKELQMPIITTSANVKGGNFMTSLDNLDLELKEAVDFVIYEGKNEGTPSKIVDLANGGNVIRK